MIHAKTLHVARQRTAKLIAASPMTRRQVLYLRDVERTTLSVMGFAAEHLFWVKGYAPDPRLRPFVAMLLRRHPELLLPHPWIAQYLDLEAPVSVLEEKGAALLTGMGEMSGKARHICTELRLDAKRLLDTTNLPIGQWVLPRNHVELRETIDYSEIVAVFAQLPVVPEKALSAAA